MTNGIKVWVPDGYTEAHRSEDRRLDLLAALERTGLTVDGSHNMVRRPDIIFCGSLFKAGHVRRVAPKGVPVIHYNWDLYPWVVKNRKEMGWDEYIEDLKACAAVLVPGLGTDLRTMQMTGRKGKVVYPPVKLWDVPTKQDVIGNLRYFRDPLPKPGKYVLDVMRNYPWDKGFTYPDEACKKLGVTLIRTATEAPWNKFRWLVANAMCLVSAVDEASTGGLTLLEGYAHGVPVVVSDSSFNEAGRYFGDRAFFFDKTEGWEGLAQTLSDSMPCPKPQPSEVAERRAWVESKFSDTLFAERIKEEVLKCLKA